MLTVSAALDAALREIDATADMDPARFDTMSALCLRSLLVGMVEQAREIRAGLLSGATR
ncbi:hypothetical protein [Roseomonas sp. KE2513]|uniref:hypothetical protein n=1 Tax=Roseomonas sp. KE2513 TaxID=2479202 RepID=UPI0018DF04E3|nr:hypothetical protein [Roseomonas sp. KE2513]